MGATAVSRAATSSNVAGSIDSRGSSGARRLAATAPTSAAAKAKLASDVDAALERTRTSLLALQGVDGSYNTAFNGGPMMVALGSLMSTACSRQDPNAQWVVDYMRAAQLPDGSFAMNPGDEPSAQATQLVALALEMIAKYEPGLAKDALAVSRKAREYSQQDPPNNGNLYGFLANVLNDLIAGTDYVKGMPMGLIMELAKGYMNGSLSNLAKVFGAAALLLFRAQAGRNGDIASVFMMESVINIQGVLNDLKASQDADGSWGWTVYGTALASIALSAFHQGDREIARGLDFIKGLREVDPKAWTRGDAWDTGLVGMTTQALSSKDDNKAAKAVKAILAGQLPDGRFSFSIRGNLGDNDTSSTALRMLCERYRVSKNDGERAQLASAIEGAATGLMAYQQQIGSWGAFTKTAGKEDPLAPPKNPSFSALYDVGSPDLSSRVARSLIAAQASGSLSAETDARVTSALSRASDYLHQAQSTKDGTWWNRWTTGRISTFAFTVPALRQLGLAADDATFANTRAFLLAHQNADGGWGETIASDRTPDARGRGPSTPMQTAAAIVGLIGTCTDAQASDPALNKALQSGIAYLLKAQHDGMFSNGTPLYTILYQEDYYDADASTTCFVAGALRLYSDFVKMGPEKAMASSSL